MFHKKNLYWLHSLHHKYKYTYGIGAIYASVPDFYFANLFPISVPMYIFAIPQYQCKLIIIFTTSYTVIISHGGFKMFTGHLMHHLKSRVNYGLINMDKILGTKYKSIK